MLPLHLTDTVFAQGPLDGEAPAKQQLLRQKFMSAEEISCYLIPTTGTQEV